MPHAALAIVCSLLFGIALMVDAPQNADLERLARVSVEHPGLVRDEVVLPVRGWLAPEVWQLRWSERPQPICRIEGGALMSAPCAGFAYGDLGDLVLRRTQGARLVEEVHLGQYFGIHEVDGPAASRGLVIASRWTPEEQDANTDISSPLELELKVQEISARPVRKLLLMRDYDGDGAATEFLLQVGSYSGRPQSIALGLSRGLPKIRALGTAENPARSLLLPPYVWELLSTHRNFSGTFWACDDHGSKVAIELDVWVDRNGIHARERTYDCPRSKGDVPRVFDR